MRTLFFTLVSIFFISNGLSAQAEDKMAVEKVVQTMFEGMRLGDSTMVSALFRKDAEFFSAFIDKEGKSVLSKGSVQKWLDAIGTPHDQVWNEEWWNPSIHVDGNFAHVWTPYAFYVDDTFSHCGVDSFHMVKDDSETWKVFHATDTKRKGGCEDFIPAEIKAKHSKK